ncbi:MAG: chlorite dismutase family protein [Acidobacteriota bacterium]|jgi:chlorite dismutase
MPDRVDPSDRPDRTLGHFACFTLGDAFWSLGPEDRRELLDDLMRDARDAAPRVELYQLYPTRSDADLLLWSALPAEDPAAPARFFEGFGRAVSARRPALVPSHTFWGLTRPSPYTGRGGSSREIDAVGGERETYLIVYPFAKTARWYLRAEGERREMMRDHIRVGREFEGVRQLLLYSFGLQDQEFVVVYETHDLSIFSELVHALRSTEARSFTALDTPILTAVHRGSKGRDGEGAASVWT